MVNIRSLDVARMIVSGVDKRDFLSFHAMLVGDIGSESVDSLIKFPKSKGRPEIVNFQYDPPKKGRQNSGIKKLDQSSIVHVGQTRFQMRILSFILKHRNGYWAPRFSNAPTLLKRVR